MLIALLSMIVVPSLDPLPDILGDVGFEKKGRSWFNASRNETLFLSARKAKPGQTLDESWQGFLSGFAKITPDLHERIAKTASGFPLGERLYFSVGGATSKIDVFTQEVHVRLLIPRSADRMPSGGIKVRAGWGSSEGAVLEAVARWRVAQAVGEAMQPQTVTVGNLSINGLEASTGVQLVNVKEWASRTGKAFTLNQNAGRAMLGSGSSAVIIPLGSPKIKVGANWVTLPHVVPVKGLDPYLPVSTLQSLGG